MGFDITFHPVAVADLQHFVFDVAGDGKLAKSRAKELTDRVTRQREMIDMLGRLPGFVKSVKEEGEFSHTIAFVAAAVAGYRHPYWYARSSAVSRLAIHRAAMLRFFTSLTRVAKGVIAKVDDDSGGIFDHEASASGIILPEQILPLRDELERLAQPVLEGQPAPLFRYFGQDSLPPLLHALAYAAEHGLGMMEATELVLPDKETYFTNPENMRAEFLKNMDYAKPGRSPRIATKAKAKAKKKKKASAKTAAKTMNA